MAIFIMICLLNHFCLAVQFVAPLPCADYVCPYMGAYGHIRVWAYTVGHRLVWAYTVGHRLVWAYTVWAYTCMGIYCMGIDLYGHILYGHRLVWAYMAYTCMGAYLYGCIWVCVFQHVL